MSVKEIINKKGGDVVTIDSVATVKDAANLMDDRGIGALVVTHRERIVGLVTQRDIVKTLARHVAVASLAVSDVMQKSFEKVTPAATIKAVMALMTARRATHVPVMEDNKLAGIISIGDVVKHRLEDLELETNVLRDVYIAVH